MAPRRTGGSSGNPGAPNFRLTVFRPPVFSGETQPRVRMFLTCWPPTGSVSSMLSRNLEQTLHRALGLANERRHEYATLEHLLLALTDDTDAATVLRACGVDNDKLKRDLTE